MNLEHLRNVLPILRRQLIDKLCRERNVEEFRILLHNCQWKLADHLKSTGVTTSDDDRSTAHQANLVQYLQCASAPGFVLVGHIGNHKVQVLLQSLGAKGVLNHKRQEYLCQ